MKRQINAKSLVDQFLEWHDDETNYHQHPDDFDKMYEILNKYGNSDDTVDIPFNRATPEDQRRMCELIRPKRRPGDDGYARDLYMRARNDERDGDFYSKEYNEGVVDAFQALFKEGFIERSDF